MRCLNESIRWNNEAIHRLNNFLSKNQEINKEKVPFRKIKIDIHVATWETDYNVNTTLWDHGKITERYISKKFLNNGEYNNRINRPSHICRAHAIDEIDHDIENYHSILLSRPDLIYYVSETQTDFNNMILPHIANIKCVSGELRALKLCRTPIRDWQCDDRYITIPIKTFQCIKKNIKKVTKEYYEHRTEVDVGSNHKIFLDILTISLRNDDERHENQSWGIISSEYSELDLRILRKEILDITPGLVYNYENFCKFKSMNVK